MAHQTLSPVHVVPNKAILRDAWFWPRLSRAHRTNALTVSRAWPTSHRQNDAELCVAAQHSRISLGRSFERIGFNHGTHAGQFGEAQSVLRIGWCSRGPALDGFTSANELYRSDLNGVDGRPETIDQLRHRFRAWGGRQNDLSPAQLLQRLGCVRRLAVDVHVRSEFLCQRRVFGAAPDSRDLITELVRELNSEV